MEDALKQIAFYVALAAEAAAVSIIALGAFQAIVALVKYGPEVKANPRHSQFPGWADIGQLAAIAVIRTFLNYFLEKDLEKYGEPETKGQAEQKAA